MSLSPAEQSIRATGVGASEVAALVGLSSYETPMSLWLKKRGLTEDAENESIEWGNLLEPVIAGKWAQARGAIITKGTTLRHPVYPHVLATPDYLTDLNPEGGVLEVKTAGLRMAHLWGGGGDEIPEGYLVQVQMQLAVTLRPIWHLAALVGGQDYREYDGEADRELQDGLCDAIETFWAKHVEADIPPPLDATEATQRWLRSRFPQALGEMREASSAEAKLLAEYDNARAEIRKWEETRRLISARLCDAIGPAKGLVTASGSRAAWSNRKSHSRPAVQIAAGRTLKVTIKGDNDDDK